MSQRDNSTPSDEPDRRVQPEDDQSEDAADMNAFVGNPVNPNLKKAKDLIQTFAGTDRSFVAAWPVRYREDPLLEFPPPNTPDNPNMTKLKLLVDGWDAADRSRLLDWIEQNIA